MRPEQQAGLSTYGDGDESFRASRGRALHTTLRECVTRSAQDLPSRFLRLLTLINGSPLKQRQGRLFLRWQEICFAY